MAFTQSQLDALESAIAEGALTVRLGDRMVTYQSLSEMLRLRDTIKSELGLPQTTARTGRAIQLVTGRGL